MAVATMRRNDVHMAIPSIFRDCRQRSSSSRCLSTGSLWLLGNGTTHVDDCTDIPDITAGELAAAVADALGRHYTELERQMAAEHIRKNLEVCGPPHSL